MRLSVIVPMLNEADELPRALPHLLSLRSRGCEVLLVDGGSHDGSVSLARAAGFPVLGAPCGRARQMNAGARAAHGDVLVFLHVDTQLPASAMSLIERAIDGDTHWGRFDVRLDSQALVLRLVAFLISFRSRMTGIATGDQAIFVRRSVFEEAGSFPDQALMEDIELSRRLRKLCRPACLHARVTTSARRWEARGVWRTILLMWRLRFAYWCGRSPDALAEDYR
jgi:rSAM/selenodomain-associated transferase 2